jgi:hypothetical protein
MMLRKGTITAAMRQAGDDFHALFLRAALEPLRAADLHRLPRSGAQVPTENVDQMDAHRRVWRALEAVGGIASPAGSCVWHILGCDWTIKDWALRQGWGGRPLSQEQAAADSDEARPPIPFQRRPRIPIRSRPSFRSDGGRGGVIPTGHLCSLTKCRCRSSRRLTLAQ